MPQYKRDEKTQKYTDKSTQYHRINAPARACFRVTILPRGYVIPTNFPLNQREENNILLLTIDFSLKTTERRKSNGVLYKNIERMVSEMDLKAVCLKYENKVIELRREFHMHPELSFQEIRTAQRVREELDKAGIAWENVPDTHSVIGIVKGAHPGKTIALRADMDALPMQEESDPPYKSQIEGVMHACGHDAHVAMLLGAAMTVNEAKEELAGEALFCFQSGEETGSGALKIIEYLEKRGGVDRMIGLHIWASFKEGTIVLLDGPTMAGAVGIEICITGQGGHGSRPDLAKDPVKAACDLALKISSIPSNFYDVLDHSVVHVGSIQSGTIGNIFPDKAILKCGCRYFKPGGGDKIMDHMRRMAGGVALIYDVDIEVTVKGQAPSTINNPEATARARELVRDVDGLEVDSKQQPICASDDYAYYLEKYPGFYGFLGAMNEEKGIIWTQHNSKFDVDETALRKGYEFMSRYTVDFLKPQK